MIKAIVTDIEGVIREINQTASLLLNNLQNEISGKPIDAFINQKEHLLLVSIILVYKKQMLYLKKVKLMKQWIFL